MTENSSGVGKWFSGLAATVIGAVLIWALTHPGGILNPPTPTPPPTNPPPTAAPTGPPTVPPAPTLDKSLFPSNFFEEKQQLITVEPGIEYHLRVMDIFFIPQLSEYPSCASGAFTIMSWLIQDPYPSSGDILEIRSLIHSADGISQLIGAGSEGTLNLSYCDEIFFVNLIPSDIKVRIRYASGINR